MTRIQPIVAALVALLLFLSAVLPPPAAAITTSEEEKLGREFMRLVLKHYKIVEDPYIQSYISHLGAKIVAVMPERPFTYRFFVLEEEVYNAFAAPAGNIFINSGLFAALDNEEELAGIMAHEAAHALCRHISQGIERAKKLNMVSMAGMLAGVLLGAAGAGGAAAQAVTMGSMAAGQSAWLSFSRENERQADEIGLKYLSNAGYGGKGMLTSLDKIRNKTWWTKEQVPTYLTTHPAAEDRIAYIDSWLQHQAADPATARQAARDSVDSKAFHRARNRLIALYGNEESAMRFFRQGLERDPQDAMMHYGLGLVLGRAGRREEAIQELRLALARQAFDPYLLKDLGRIYFLDGRYPDALRVLESAMAMQAEDPEAPFYYGRTLMETGRLEDARPVFEGLVQSYPGYDPALYYLGTVYGELGRLGEAHTVLGRYYLCRFDLKAAQIQFEKALERASDPQKKAEIEKLLRTVKREEKDRGKEEAESEER